MEINAQLVKELREKTGYGPKVCLEALKESQGSVEKAIEILRKRGEGKAAEMASRPTNAGLIGSYLHFNNNVAVIVEVATQTDSLAQTQELKEFATGVAMQIAFSNPKYVSREEVPAEILDKEKEIFRATLVDSGKPAQVIEKIVIGRLDKYFEEHCLLDQKYIKDDKMTIGSWLTGLASRARENIRIRRFSRMEVGK
ncbi:MAG: translation elongation factor Ts [Candidatus Brocadiia bacterium]